MTLDKQLVTKILDDAEPRKVLTEDEWQAQVRASRRLAITGYVCASVALVAALICTGASIYQMMVH